MSKEITPHDILNWVMENRDDQATIDMVSHMIFPYTSKYKSIQQQNYGNYNGYNSTGRAYHAEDDGGEVDVHI